jgi:hypothetical protein
VKPASSVSIDDPQGSVSGVSSWLASVGSHEEIMALSACRSFGTCINRN